MKKLNNQGQGLVELIVAIAIIEIGLFSVWSLFLVNFNAVREAEMRIVGVNLSREGIEVIKNIRDTNWLKMDNNVFSDNNKAKIWAWDENLVAGDYVLNYDSTDISPLNNNNNDQLYFDEAGIYTNVKTGASHATNFKRQITLSAVCCTDADHNFQCDVSNNNYLVDADDLCSGKLKIGINVVSDVSWQLNGRERHAILEDNLFNWK